MGSLDWEDGQHAEMKSSGNKAMKTKQNKKKPGTVSCSVGQRWHT